MNTLRFGHETIVLLHCRPEAGGGGGGFGAVADPGGGGGEGGGAPGARAPPSGRLIKYS